MRTPTANFIPAAAANGGPQPILRVIDNPCTEATYDTILRGRLLSVCPVTSRQDITDLVLRYTPGHSCIETESFVAWLESFKEVTMYHEALIGQMFIQLCEAIMPLKLELICKFPIRSGASSELVFRQGYDS